MLKIVERELITNYADPIVEKETGCNYMFQHSQLSELALMYRLYFRDQDTLGLIIQKMNPYIEMRGEAVVKDENLLKDPIAFTTKLLELKREMDIMVKESFNNNMQFQKGRDVSFQNFMNAC